MNLKVDIKTLLQQTWKEFGADNIARLGAALAYYTFSSFFPLLLVLISLVGIALSLGVESAEQARTYVMDAVSQNLPAAQEVMAESFQDTEQNSGTLGVVGLLTGLWAASNIFAQLEEAFNIIYDVAPRKRSFLEKLKARGKSALIVVFIALLMIGSLVSSTVIQTADSIVRTLPGGATAAWLMNLGISLALSTLVFALLFKYIPDKPVTWKAAFIGGFFTSIAWQIGRELLTWWLGRDTTSPTAGTVVGAVLAFLALIYYASQILMLGAQLTATWDQLANPDLVRHRTSEDSALRGPGQPPVKEDGETVGRASGGGRGGGGKVQPRPVSFVFGFLAGALALLVGIKTVLGNLAGRLLNRV